MSHFHRKYAAFHALIIPLIVTLFATMPSTAAEKRKLGDTDIATAVATKLYNDHAVEGFRLGTEVQDGIVTLSGEVTNLLSKERATRIAESVRGVRAVVNMIEVLPADLSDAQIRSNVESALLQDPVADSWEIDVGVSDGTVRLTGVVQSWQEMQLAAKVARGVRGVQAIDNNLEVVNPITRLDGEIRAEVQEMLKWNARVDETMIQIAVKDGKVELTGTVGSAAEKRWARQSAWVTGVKWVDDGSLEIRDWAHDPHQRTRKFVDKPDDAIVQAVEDALRYDPRVAAFNVGVESDSGVVTLTGVVTNLMARRAAGQDARNTTGVWRVKNLIRVRGEMTADDATLESRIRAALARDPWTLGHEIEVDVENSVATLSGSVDTYFEKIEAENEASGVEGVIAVRNNLDVENEYDALSYDPWVDDAWYLEDYDWYAHPFRTTLKSDWEIAQDIRDELWWSPFVDADQVGVIVEDGVATLTGTVDTYLERGAATGNALEAGARKVDNDLKVRYGPDYYRP